MNIIQLKEFLFKKFIFLKESLESIHHKKIVQKILKNYCNSHEKLKYD